MRFIDLFAGLGGFNKALSELGYQCVFASEINQPLRELYKTNWGIDPKGDIKKIVEKDIACIPPHDILCAGFPCQPFSKAGKQEGLEDKERGTLFDDIVKILSFRKPTYFILENVPFIRQHDNEETWKYMHKELVNLGYEVGHEIPHDFGIPQHRQRIFIVGSLIGLDHFKFQAVNQNKIPLISIEEFLDENPKKITVLPKANQGCLNLWQRFIEQIPVESKIPGFPIWSMEFGATYPFEESYPLKLSAKELGEFRGNFGISLKGLKKCEQKTYLPSYARVMKAFPNWKRNYIRHCREFYKDNKKYLKEIIKEISKYQSQSWQKLEWNVGESNRNIYDYIIQFRPSGIRVKKPDFFPSLVCAKTQIPIIGWQNRYITREEGLKLQSLSGVELPTNDNAAFIALGNAVNAKIVKHIAENLILEVDANTHNEFLEETNKRDKIISLATN
jgi:DNA (cytosine-5)-methyltransferase 1